MFKDASFAGGVERVDFMGHLLFPRYKIDPSLDDGTLSCPLKIAEFEVMLLSSIPVRVAFKTVKGGNVFVRDIPYFTLD